MKETFFEALDRIIAEPEEVAFAMPANATSLDLLRAVYRDPRQPVSTRMKAAIAVLAFEHPKLSVSANLNAGFAARMEAIMKERGLSPVIEARPLPQLADSRVAHPKVRAMSVRASPASRLARASRC